MTNPVTICQIEALLLAFLAIIVFYLCLMDAVIVIILRETPEEASLAVREEDDPIP